MCARGDVGGILGDGGGWAVVRACVVWGAAFAWFGKEIKSPQGVARKNWVLT
jgi:hypothetical protein